MNFYDVEADLYDLFYFSFDRDISIYRRHLCPRVLEFFCGTGRIIHHLAPEYAVGVDINERMLEYARRNLENLNARLVKEDVLNLHLGEKFCLVIIGLNSLMMFPREDRIRVLRKAREHLSPEGRVIVDVLNPFIMIEDIVHHGDTVERDGRIYSRFFSPRWRGDHWDIHYFYDIVEDGIVKRRYSVLKLYPIYLKNLKEEAKRAGLKIVELYGDYNMADYVEEESERIIAVMEMIEDV